jgi:transposase
VAEARAAHIAGQPDMDIAKLVFIDETGVTTNMIRRYGRAPKGERLVDKTPHGHWKITTCVAALTSAGVAALGTIDGAMNGELFLAWTVQILVPSLKPGDIVIWDNLPCHKNKAARAAIEAAGAIVRPLPAYSPDLNPIEKAFAKLKARLRKEKPRTPRAIDRWIARIFKAFTPQECVNYFASCGYSK